MLIKFKVCKNLHRNLLSADRSAIHRDRAVFVLLVTVVAVLVKIGVRDKFEVRDESGTVMILLLELYLMKSQAVNPKRVTP